MPKSLHRIGKAVSFFIVGNCWIGKCFSRTLSFGSIAEDRRFLCFCLVTVNATVYLCIWPAATDGPEVFSLIYADSRILFERIYFMEYLPEVISSTLRVL